MLFCASGALALFFEEIVLVKYSLFSFVLLFLNSSSMALSIK